MLTKILTKHWRLALEGITLAGFVLYGSYLQHQITKTQKQADKAAAVVAVQEGGIVGKRVGKVETGNKALAAFVEKEKVAGAKPIESSNITAEIKDTAKGVATPTSVEDEYGRFHFDLPSGLLTRHQLFKIGSVVVRTQDGKYEFTKNDFREYSPKTGEEIPTTGVAIKGDFQFVEEGPPQPKLFHPRLVALVDSHKSLGVGAEVLNIKDRVTVGVAGTYNPQTKKAGLLLFPSVRVLNSNVSAGVAYNPISRSVSGLVTFQITR